MLTSTTVNNRKVKRTMDNYTLAEKHREMWFEYHIHRDWNLWMHYAKKCTDYDYKKWYNKETYNNNLNCVTVTHTYIVTTPTGKQLEITNLRDFCRANQLDNGTMRKAVAKGHTTKTGWAARRI